MRPNLARPAFTLWEVMLAMTIGAVILAALGMAIDLHLRVLDTGRGEVEQALLARAVLERIADDLHSAVLYQPIDMEALLESALPMAAALPVSESSSQGSQPSGQQGGGQQSGGGNTGGQQSGGSSGSQDMTAEAEAAADEAAAAAALQPAPGVYGNQTEMAIDVSRLPRLDQYQQLMAADVDQPVDRVSDVKTVTYFVQYANGAPGGAVDGAGGLMRRERDRAASTWSQLDADALGPGESLAPEVVALEFRYFDGQEWNVDWDSTDRKGLPVAVEVMVAIAPPAEGEPAPLGSLSDSAAMDDLGYQVYRLLVHLPAARPSSLTEIAEEEGESAQEEEGEGETP